MKWFFNLSITFAFLVMSMTGTNAAERDILTCDIKVLGDVPVTQSHREIGADNLYKTDLLYNGQWASITVGVIRQWHLSELYKPEDRGLSAQELMKKVHDRYENVWREYAFSETELKGKKPLPLGALKGQASVWELTFEQQKSAVALWSVADTVESIIVVTLSAMPSEGMTETLSESGAYTLIEDTLSQCKIHAS